MADPVESVLTTSQWMSVVSGVVGPFLGGIFGYMIARRNSRTQEKIAYDQMLAEERHTHAVEIEQHRKERQDDARARIEAHSAQTDGLTERFKTLMDGYESRITDLTREVASLRDQVQKLRSVLDARTAACSTCPIFQKLVHDGAINGVAIATT